MATWYYQCSASISDAWGLTYESDFRLEVREWAEMTWPGLGGSHLRIRPLYPDTRPIPGDRIIVGFAKTDAETPGVVAVGLVVAERKESVFRWRALPPTGRLVMRPAWSPRIQQLIDKIRGGMNALTIYEAPPAEADELLAEIMSWSAGTPGSGTTVPTP